ncbi:helix-turn-helix domain-containing protein [Novosphingobium sp. KACC 22771]|uniref:helix-turn-helix domain-containing protein n=1 Tax=Novosphingobium sp. KACC 22771 TaxID=3025670 RepID=UPI00236500B1|nr:helix-turn-helix domain-containing protein [Novosphingobium sp. KACC 22771]WDF73457.1 helix-turn-helix domain-containing protein [Novosphingobium sp. KACC 22771]
MSTTLAHRGLPAGVGRFDLLRLFEQVARPGFGLSSTAVALVRHYVLKTMDGDYLSGRICAVWTQARRFAEQLGLTPRSINSAERELEQAGFIVRNAGINGERAGDRQDGIVVWAAGINLAPLVERFAEMQAKAEALELQARAIQQCRAEIRQLGQRIREAGDEDLRERAETILPDGRTARITSIDRLIAIREALSAMLAAIESAPEPEPRALKTSDAPEENCAPNIQDKNSSRRRTTRPSDPLERIRPATALVVATESYRGVVEGLGGPTWPNLVEASWRSCGRLGIAQSTWGRACQQFGRERAALSVLLIDRNAELPLGHRYRVGSPARCLAGMMRKSGSAGVNLAGLFQATKRNAQQVPSEAPLLELAIEPQAGPLAHLTARLMASMERRVAPDG